MVLSRGMMVLGLSFLCLCLMGSFYYRRCIKDAKELTKIYLGIEKQDQSTRRKNIKKLKR